MRSRLLLLGILANSVLLLTPSVGWGDPDLRYQMLVNAEIDGYPTDDDVTAISRYLTAVGDGHRDLPDGIANWIIGSNRATWAFSYATIDRRLHAFLTQ